MVHSASFDTDAIAHPDPAPPEALRIPDQQAYFVKIDEEFLQGVKRLFSHGNTHVTVDGKPYTHSEVLAAFAAKAEFLDRYCFRAAVLQLLSPASNIPVGWGTHAKA